MNLSYDPKNELYQFIAFCHLCEKYVGFRKIDILLYCFFVTNDDVGSKGRAGRIASIKRASKEKCYFEGESYTKCLIPEALFQRAPAYSDVICFFAQIKSLRKQLGFSKLKDPFQRCSFDNFILCIERFNHNFNDSDFLLVRHLVFEALDDWENSDWANEKSDAFNEDRIMHAIRKWNLFLLKNDISIFGDDRLDISISRNYQQQFILIIKFFFSYYGLTKFDIEQLVFSLYLDEILVYENQFNNESDRKQIFAKREKEKQASSEAIYKAMKFEEYSLFDLLEQNLSGFKTGYLLDEYIKSAETIDKSLLNLKNSKDELSKYKKLLMDCLWSLSLKHTLPTQKEYLNSKGYFGFGTHPMILELMKFANDIEV